MGGKVSELKRRTDLYIKLKDLIQKNSQSISDSEQGIYQTKSGLSQCYTLLIEWIKFVLNHAGLAKKEGLELINLLDTTLFVLQNQDFRKDLMNKDQQLHRRKVTKICSSKAKVGQKRFDLVHSTQLANQSKINRKGKKYKQNQRQTC